MRSAIVVGAAIWSQQWARLAMWLGSAARSTYVDAALAGFRRNDNL